MVDDKCFGFINKLALFLVPWHSVDSVVGCFLRLVEYERAVSVE
jgi:hypothetical protein